MPKISVIIPVYKVERYLDACVASVAGQTYADLEIILVDDGSPDSCPAMCDAWAKRMPASKLFTRRTLVFQQQEMLVLSRQRANF